MPAIEIGLGAMLLLVVFKGKKMLAHGSLLPACAWIIAATYYGWLWGTGDQGIIVILGVAACTACAATDWRTAWKVRDILERRATKS